MYVVQKDMKDLKEKANSERIKAKMDARLVHLEKERDWFRAECLQLDKMNKDMKKLLATLKVRLETESEERETLHN
jgi:flagellar motility protein MotE (MotC chaperone)